MPGLRPPSTTAAYVIVVSAATLAAWAAYAQLLGLFESAAGPREAIASLLIFDRFAIEVLAVLVLGMWLLSGPAVTRAVAYGLALAVFAAHIVQLASLRLSGSLVPRLAIQNVESIRLVVDAQILGMAVAMLATTASLVVALLLATSPIWLPADVESHRRAQLRVRSCSQP